MEKLSFLPTWAFDTIVDGVLNSHYEFDSREKAEQWQARYIHGMKKIGCWPIKGVTTKVVQL